MTDEPRPDGPRGERGRRAVSPQRDPDDPYRRPQGEERRNLRRRTMHGMLAMTVSTGGQAVLQVVFLSVLARLIVPKEFGLVSGALIAVNLTTVLAESGVGAAIVQREIVTRTHMRVAYTISVSLGVIAWAVLFALAPGIEQLLRLPGLTPIVRVIALVFVINNLTLSDYLLARRLQFSRLATAELTAYAVGYGGVAITLAHLGYGAWSIVGGQLAQSTLRTILVTSFAPHAVAPSFARQPMKELVNYGGGYSIGRVALWAATQLDNFVVGRYLGAKALGLYGRAYQLVQMPANLFGQVANEVLFPAMAAVQSEEEKLRRVFRVSVAFLALLAMPTAVLAAVTSKPLVLVVLGKDWLPLRTAFDVIIFGLLFRTSSKLTDSVMKARGAVYRRAWRSIAFAVFVFVGAFVGKGWGLHGVAVGVLIALGLNYLLTNQLCLVLVGMSWRDFVAAHGAAAVMSVVAGGVGFGLERGLHSAGVGVGMQLLVVWLAALAVCLVVVRIAWRWRVLSPVSTLVITVHSFLSGPLRRGMSTVLGPGYRSLATPTSAVTLEEDVVEDVVEDAAEEPEPAEGAR